jgi:hypothetical protein
MQSAYTTVGSSAKILIALKSSILTNKQVEDVASSLPSSAGFADVLHILADVLHILAEAENHSLDPEWRTILQIAKSGQPLKVGEQLTVDPIVARVRADMSLNRYERKLLDCIVDPSQFLDLS